MLSVNKNFRRQRSSLEVNLSWIPSSTDSVDNTSIYNTNDTVSHNTHIRNGSKVEENAVKDSEMPSKNSKILKVTNLIKAKEICNKQDEISLERRRILSGKYNGLSKAIKNDIKCTIMQNKSVSSMSTFTSKSKGNSRKNRLCQSISSSPKEKCKEIYASNSEEPKKCMEKEKHKLCLQLNSTHTIIDDVNLKCHVIEQDLVKLNCKNGINGHALSKLNQEAQIEHFSPHDVLKNKYTPIFVEQRLEEIGANIYPTSSQNSRTKLSNENVNIIVSLNTEQSSLDVNTSFHVAAERNNCTCKHKWKYCEEEQCEMLENKQKDMCPVILERTEESVNTICSSLQMNTSLGTLNRLQDEEIDISNTSNTESNDFVDINTRSCKLQPPVNFVLDEVRHNDHSSAMHDMTILSHKLSEKLHNTSEISPITEESFHKNESDRNKSKKCLIQFSDKPKHKKKLLPLQECSQLLSFSPIQEECTHPQSKTFKKKQRKKINKYKKKSHDNNVHCTETKENRNIIEKKQVRKARKILSKKIIVKKINNEDILRELDINKKSDVIDVEVCTLKRGSSNDFQPLKKPLVLQVPRKLTERINIVVTGLSNEDKDLVKMVVKTLGFAKMGSNVTKHTTHVVTTGMRTINLLHAIIRGCWLVSLEWILKSFEKNTWINPEKYEMAHFSKAALENRKDRQMFGKSYVPELFAACGYIYIGSNTTPPSKVLKGLVKAAGGCITENSENAKILIGRKGLKETWILDCITSGELQPYSYYQQT